ncbi:hypothetical protein Pelo_9064 [Pelomyxa schiedti]|nr:hypothetical protein Pelo_9064 [Pelomyxa schiedti]
MGHAVIEWFHIGGYLEGLITNRWWDSRGVEVLDYTGPFTEKTVTGKKIVVGLRFELATSCQPGPRKDLSCPWAKIP